MLSFSSGGPQSGRFASDRNQIHLSPGVARFILQICLPLAWRWATRQESQILRAGVCLTASLLADARKIGIRHPERVRLMAADVVPPMNPVFRFAARQIGLCSPLTSGMSLRYGILISTEWWGERPLIVHELAHTRQYECFGGIRQFLKEYLFECLVAPGYPLGPLEQEAAAVARELCG